MSDRSNWGSKLGFILAATGSAVGFGRHMEVPIYGWCKWSGSAFPTSFHSYGLYHGSSSDFGRVHCHRTCRKRERCHQLQKNCRSSLGTFRFHRRLLRLLNHDLLQQRRRLVLNLSIRIRHGKKPHLLIWLSWKKTFTDTVSTPLSAIIYQTLFLAITAGILIFGVNKGIERISKILMPLLFVLMIILIVKGLTLPGATEGLKFLFAPRWGSGNSQLLAECNGFYFLLIVFGHGHYDYLRLLHQS